MRKLTLFLLISAIVATTSNCSLSTAPSVPEKHSDLPKNPIGAAGVDVVTVATAFNAADEKSSGGPCISEPTMGAVYPRNFAPPLIEWIPPAEQNMFEVRLRVDNQLYDLVLYTPETRFVIPDDAWAGLTQHSQERGISISIRGGHFESGALSGNAVFAGSSGQVRIAAGSADGAIVYWTTSFGSALKGFRIGDRQVRTVLSPEMITAAGKPTGCVGCHAASPDGALVFFGRTEPSYSIDARMANGTGQAPTAMDLTPNALANLGRLDQNAPTFSRAHYSSTDATVLTSLNHPSTANKWEIVWTDLHAQSGGTGIIARQGDSRGAAHQTWSHDGERIVYVSSNSILNARVDRGDADLWVVPYNKQLGGQATELPGANLPDTNQYYPAFSPRDTFVAFNRNPRGSQMYDSPNADVYVISGAGGDTVRMSANDPPKCTGQTSPGLTNSWPRWAPTVSSDGTRNYYWLVFSSKRRRSPTTGLPIPQLYLSAIVTRSEPTGEVLEQDSPAVYIPTQPASESNHTPAWDDFAIPAG